LVDPTFEALEFDNEKEEDDSSSIETNTNVKNKGPKMCSQAKPINLDNPPSTQLEVGESSQQPLSSSTLEKDILLAMGNLYVGHV
jgi:hypothetical protein